MFGLDRIAGRSRTSPSSGADRYQSPLPDRSPTMARGQGRSIGPEPPEGECRARNLVHRDGGEPSTYRRRACQSLPSPRWDVVPSGDPPYLLADHSPDVHGRDFLVLIMP